MVQGVRKSFTGAFVIPTAMYKGQKYLYFGIEKNSKEVSAFGGKRDKNEKIQKTAVRELREESHGVFAKDKTIKTKLADQQKYHVHKIDTHNTCVSYLVPVEPKGSPMERFAKANQKSGLKRHQREMIKVIAVKASDIIQQVNAHSGNLQFHGHPSRALLNSVLREAVAKNYL